MLKIIFVGLTQDRSKQGVHLIEPDEYEVLDAMETAWRDNFDAVYVHSNDLMPSDIDEVFDPELDLENPEYQIQLIDLRRPDNVVSLCEHRKNKVA